jgi:beta-lactamase class A
LKQRILILLFLATSGCEREPGPAIADAVADLLRAKPEATVGISVRDLESGFVYDHLADREFHAASTMKVAVMIEVFRRAERGEFALNDSIQVRNAFRSIVDGSTYAMDIGEDSDDSVYGRIGERMSIRDLVVQMITVSSNLATNILIDFVTPDSVQATIEALGTTTMKVRRGVEDIKAYRLGLNNTATALDLAILLEHLARGEAVSSSADAEMISILADQQFNEMIPAGLSPEARVAHKTGQITRIHHDAAIVFPPAGSPYVLVILIEGIADASESSQVGAEIARRVHAALGVAG